ncbi:MAG: Mur ligase domain-containing protein [Acidimicrobiales bacterium]
MTTPVSAGAAIDLRVHQRVHVVGVGGAGMSAIASVLAAMGHRVSGTDMKATPGLERLRAQGVEVHVGHDPAHLGPVDAVAASTAVPAANSELRAARDRGIPVLSRAQILAAIAATRATVAVSGTHGKTTTASMLALVLVEADLQPSFVIGGELNEIGSGAVWGKGEWFVVEADESDGTFVELGARMAVVTNVEADHLDFYGDLATIEATFDRFLADAPGPNLVCADDPGAARLAARHESLTYGTDPTADYRILDPRTGRAGASFTLAHGALAGRGAPSRPRSAQHPQRHRRHRGRHAGRRTVRAGRDAESRYAGGPALPVPRGGRRRHRRRRLCPQPGQGEGGVGGRGPGLGPRGGRLPTPPVLTHDRPEEAFADAFVDADVLVLTDVYGAGEAP